jgi:UDP-N-acetylmuramoyl-tripeptide--D-alanyl-D-alanine ligase
MSAANEMSAARAMRPANSLPARADVVLDFPAIIEALEGLAPAIGASDLEHPLAGPAITGCAIDSRTIRPGDLFVALPGAHVHGARFVAAAFAAGAVLAVVARRDESLVPAAADRSRLVWVDDAALALTALGRAARRRWPELKVVAVTGSYGKTTTKEWVAAVLGSSLRVHRTPGNFNNHLGVPITLLGLTARHQAAVIEMGMNAPGEIGALAELAAPQIGVVTGIGRAHLAGLKTRAAIIAAKLELAQALGPEGLLILAAGDLELLAAARRAGPRLCLVDAGSSANATTEPTAGESVLAAKAVALDAAGCVRFRVDGLGFDGIEVVLRAPARILVTNALLALAAGAALELDRQAMVRALGAVQLPDRRLTLKRAGSVLVLDDCYNANPESMAGALATLGDLDVHRRIAVLGDMRELGSASQASHQELGERAGAVLDRLYVIGEEAATVAQAARASGMAAAQVIQARDREELIRELIRELRPGDGVLVKASRALGLEAVVDAILRSPMASPPAHKES